MRYVPRRCVVLWLSVVGFAYTVQQSCCAVVFPCGFLVGVSAIVGKKLLSGIIDVIRRPSAEDADKQYLAISVVWRTILSSPKTVLPIVMQDMVIPPTVEWYFHAVYVCVWCLGR
jgi:hypothetical protein